MKCFDARCEQCGVEHIVWVGWEHEEGDTVYIAHKGKFKGCSGYGEHTLLRELSGNSDHPKWGPPEETTE